jgi:toxin ParE1/3/4
VKLYLLSKPAARDLESIQSYLVKEAGKTVAKNVMRELRQAMRFLTVRPGAGHVREDLAEITVRFWPVYSYLVIYDPARNPIEIVRVVHGSQDVAGMRLGV